MSRHLLFEALHGRMLLTTVTDVEPPANSHNVAMSTDITATFDQNLIAGTATSANFVVHGTVSRGRLTGEATTVSAAGAVITQSPTNDFAAGEVVQITATSGISAADGPADPRVWQFRTASAGTGRFVDGGARLGTNGYRHVSLGDIDGDSDLDMVLDGSELWFNDGSGGFNDSGQNLGEPSLFGVEFADIDGDGDLDLVGGSRVLRNDGNGVVANTGQDLGQGSAALGDVDGDGDLDVLMAGGMEDVATRVWHNDGGGQFTDSGQALASDGTEHFVLGDFDSDGDLDAFDITYNSQDRIWTNDGTGIFTEMQELNEFRFGRDAKVGDVDGDGDLDVVVSNSIHQDGVRIYLNENGVFTELIQEDVPAATEGPEGRLYSISLGDLDGDNDLDIYAAQQVAAGSEIWLNDGRGNFSDSGQRLSSGGSRPIFGTDLGDIDGDGDLDIVEVFDDSVGGARVWLNENQPASFHVSGLTPTSTGFVAEFGASLDASALSLYDTQTSEFGPPDLVLEGATSGVVPGTLVVDSSLRKVTFVTTGAPLEADSYTVTLRSSENAFKDANRHLLDGNADGTTGDDYTGEFVIPSPPANAVTLSLPDFVRGPGQAVNVPATIDGLPLTISDGTQVRNVSLQIAYDESLLQITDASVGAQMPAGAAVSLDMSTPGLALVTFTSAINLPAGPNTLVNLEASVPSANASENYLRNQVVDIHSVAVIDGSANNLPVIENDAVHAVHFFGDVSGNGRINASDAALVARVSALLDKGFGADPRTDPGIVGDISGNGRLNAGDASLVARAAALLDVPQIPLIPGNVAVGVAARNAVIIPWGSQDAKPDVDGKASIGSDYFESLFGSSPLPYLAVDRAIVELNRPSMPEDELQRSLDDSVDELLGR